MSAPKITYSGGDLQPQIHVLETQNQVLLSVLPQKEAKTASPRSLVLGSHVVEPDNHLRNSLRLNATGDQACSDSPRFVRLSVRRTVSPGTSRGTRGLHETPAASLNTSFSTGLCLSGKARQDKLASSAERAPGERWWQRSGSIAQGAPL